MDAQNKIDEIIARYQNRINLSISQLRDELMELAGLGDLAVEEIYLGDARKMAILSDCLKMQDECGEIRKQVLSAIASKYGRQPATVGIFFRSGVELMETKGHANLRYVTEKGRKEVKAFKEKYGENWISGIEDLLKDKWSPDVQKIKIKLNHRGIKNEQSTD